MNGLQSKCRSGCVGDVLNLIRREKCPWKYESLSATRLIYAKKHQGYNAARRDMRDNFKITLLTDILFLDSCSNRRTQSQIFTQLAGTPARRLFFFSCLSLSLSMEIAPIKYFASYFRCRRVNSETVTFSLRCRKFMGIISLRSHSSSQKNVSEEFLLIVRWKCRSLGGRFSKYFCAVAQGCDLRAVVTNWQRNKKKKASGSD